MRTSLLRLCPYRKYFFDKEKELDKGAKSTFSMIIGCLFLGGFAYIQLKREADPTPRKRF